MAVPMPELDPGEPHPYALEFARMLKVLRRRQGLTVRELAAASEYSHSQIVRAAQGKTVGSWELVCAYLRCCGVGGEALQGWRTLWKVARSAQKELRLRPEVTADRVWFWTSASQQWAVGLDATRRPEPLTAVLDNVEDPGELNVAITALATRSGLVSVRAIESRTGVSKSTVHRWLTGVRTPTEEQLSRLVEALGATPAECAAFKNAFTRVVVDAFCREPHPPTGGYCVRTRLHRGWHRTANGRKWLEDGELEESFFPEYGGARGGWAPSGFLQ